MRPWHGFGYDPVNGDPPDEGYDDAATPYAGEERDGGVFVELPTIVEQPSLMDQMVDVMTDWGVDTVFGMVGHSNLGLADAFRKAEVDGRLRYFGIRHEGAAALPASAYGTRTGLPAACFSLACTAPTHRLTGLWADRSARPPTPPATGAPHAAAGVT